jgi:hypothetical protein
MKAYVEKKIVIVRDDGTRLSYTVEGEESHYKDGYIVELNDDSFRELVDFNKTISVKDKWGDRTIDYIQVIQDEPRISIKLSVHREPDARCESCNNAYYYDELKYIENAEAIPGAVKYGLYCPACYSNLTGGTK